MIERCEFCPLGHSFDYQDGICTCLASEGTTCLGCKPGEILNENGFCLSAIGAQEQSGKRAIVITLFLETFVSARYFFTDKNLIQKCVQINFYNYYKVSSRQLQNI